MDYREGAYNNYEYYDNMNNDNDNDNNNTSYNELLSYEYYSLMCFLLLIASISGCMYYYKNNENILSNYTKEKLIKKKKVKYKKGESKFKDITCSICLDDFKENNILLYLECGHYYHEECSKSWFKSGKSCPLCRSSFL